MSKNNIIAIMFSFVLIAEASVAQKKDSQGWVNLCNGKDLSGWKKVAGSAEYKVENGEIVGTTKLNSPNTFLVTEKEYGDFVLEVDSKIEGTNSGIQTRSHFDASGNNGKGKVYGRQIEFDPTERKWSGGVYDEARRLWLYPLDLNPASKNAYKVGEYNHIKIECIGNTTKTWINGVPAAYVVDTIDKKGFIGLQVHSISRPEDVNKRVYFRNLRIKTSNIKAQDFPKGIYVVNFTPNELTRYEKKDGWKLLFNGKSSKGWKSARGASFPDKGWEIKNGTISTQEAGGGEAANGGDIVTVDQYKAFDLSFEFKLSPGANSGVKYFVTLKEKTDKSAIGLEYQILDDQLHPDAKLGRNGNRTLSSLYDLITSSKQARFIHAVGDWNTGRVVVYPDHKVEHYLNGSKVVEYVRGSKEFKDIVAMSKYKNWENFGQADEGHILLQDHGNYVSYKNIKIKVLK